MQNKTVLCYWCKGVAYTGSFVEATTDASHAARRSFLPLTQRSLTNVSSSGEAPANASEALFVLPVNPKGETGGWGR